ncbi:MAG: hypothetical protein M8357_12340 [Desulfobulbaceae bacterium]|nr:hypothetical protein [Desulfobulbaceae bacterium]
MIPDTMSPQQLFYAPAADKLRLAEELLQTYGAEFLRCDDLRADLELLEKYASVLNSHMAKAGMGELCVRCSAGSGGGCCSLYMAGETDAVQLLMNMLAGVTVRQGRSDSGECCYLGEKGCLFIFKPMFCLNYNCRNILEALPPENTRKLEQLTGQLLGRQYEVEKKLLNLISARMNK